MNQLVYLAGPISGLTYEQATDWRKEVSKKVPYWLGTLDPMRGKDYLKGEYSIQDQYEGAVMSTAKGINASSFNDVKRAGAVLVNFEGAKKVSIGTVMEIAWAKSLNVPVICVLPAKNVHDHAMINESIDFKCKSLAEAINCVVRLLGNDNQVEAYIKSLKLKTPEPKSQTPETKKWEELLKDALKVPPTYRQRTEFDPFEYPYKYGNFSNGVGQFTQDSTATTCGPKVDQCTADLKGNDCDIDKNVLVNSERFTLENFEKAIGDYLVGIDPHRLDDNDHGIIIFGTL